MNSLFDFYMFCVDDTLFQLHLFLGFKWINFEFLLVILLQVIINLHTNVNG